MKFKSLIVLTLLFALIFAVNTRAQVADFAYSSSNEPVIDSLNLSYGKPKVFLIQIDSYSNVISVGNDTEIKELKSNFSDNDFNLYHITNQAYIKIENGQFIDVSDLDNSYEAVVFWGGKDNDVLEVQDGIRKATEFVASHLGVNKKSSYVLNDDKLKKELTNFPKEENFTDKSKILMTLFLQNHAVSKICFIDNNLVFNRNQAKVKSITGYDLNSDGKKIKKEFIQLNTFGLPIKTTFFNDDGKTPSNEIEFIYEKNVLKAIKNENSTDQIHFNDTELNFISDLGAADETTTVTLKNGELLTKRILMMKEDGAEEYNTLVEERLEKNEINYYINNVLWTSKSHSEYDIFPYFQSYISFQDGEVLQKLHYKVLKINASKFEIIFEDSLSDLNGKATIILNERGLLESYSYKKGSEIEKYLLEYDYYD